MAASNGHIILDTRVDTAGVTKGFAAIKNGASSVMGVVGKLGAAIGIAFGVSALVKFAKESIELSSDVQEVQNVVDVSFGEMSDQMEAFADTAIEKFGISALTAKRTGSTYMAMAKGMGIAGQEAADMALNLTGLSADMASFYNVSQKYTDIALKSVFTGETETLKQYGIVMTQTNLQEFARQQGITKSIQSMTQQEQTMLRYQYVMKQTALAQGDFSRTQDSWANQTRILSERWKEMQIVWGDAFRTIGTLILPAINTLIKGLTTVAQYAKAAAQAIARMFGKEIDSSEETSNNISESVDNQNQLTDAVKETTKAANNQLASFDEINTLSKETAKDTGTGGGGVSAGTGGATAKITTSPIIDTTDIEKKITDLVNRIKNTFAPIGDYIKRVFGPAFNSIGQTAQNVWGRIKNSASLVINDLSANVFPRIGTTFRDDILPILGDALDKGAKLFDTFSEASHRTFDKIYTEFVSPFAQRFVNIWGDMWDQTKQAWDEHSEPIFEGFNSFIENIQGVWETFWDNFLKPIFDNIGAIIDWLWDKHLKGLWENITGFIGDAIEWLLVLWNNVLLPIVNFIIKWFGPPIVRIFNFIGNVIGTVVGVISDVISGWLRMMRGLLKFLTGVFTGDWKKAWQGIKDFFGGIWDGIWGIVKGVINLIVDALNFIWSNIYAVFSGIANGIGGAIGWIGSLFGKDWGFSLPKDPPLIPKLATGAVLPANKPFLAQLGDQKNGRNLEAPESLLREIYSEQNQPMIAILSEMLAELKKGHVIKADKREIAKTVREGESELGNSFVTGGFANAY